MAGYRPFRCGVGRASLCWPAGAVSQKGSSDTGVPLHPAFPLPAVMTFRELIPLSELYLAKWR